MNEQNWNRSWSGLKQLLCELRAMQPGAGEKLGRRSGEAGRGRQRGVKGLTEGGSLGNPGEGEKTKVPLTATGNVDECG